ncbi:MAG TPA: histidine--tRNA ligase [Thermoplasmata archaeon]|jgi:histidyl-tRNA synthetase|nr:histidine--tRNA ligase [Thermoplasmata archaeon]
MVERPRGTRDLDPAYLARHRAVEGAHRRTAESFGYREVLPPTFESLELFHKKAGPGIEEEMYAFKDKGGRDLVLRPEFTAGVLRYYVNDLRNAPKPIKLYSIGPTFRYEEPQKGRYREFWQYNCELIGGAPLDADAETVALAVQSIRNTGVRQVETRIGHIGMLRAFLKVDKDAQNRILHALDKRNFEMLHRELDAARLLDLEGTLRSLIAIRGGGDALEKASDLLGGTGSEGFDHLRAIRDRLVAYGIRDGVVFDMGIIRGLSYYTGMVFQIHSPNLGAEDQVGGGGSYALAELFGGDPIFSTGFAIGMDRVVLAAEVEGVAVPPPKLDAYVIPIGDSARPKAFEIAANLRSTGLAVDIDLVGRGPSKNLDYANAIGARWSVIVGEKELAKGSVALRNMETGEQREVPVGELASVLGMDKPAMGGVEYH